MAHADPILPLLLSLAVILIAAKIGVDLAVRAGQPAVLGELVVGVVLGNLGLGGFHGLEFLRSSDALSLLAGLGVLVLLLQVGPESTVAQMLKVGPSAFLVAVTGVLAPTFPAGASARGCFPMRVPTFTPSWGPHLQDQREVDFRKG